ncbi:MAG: methyl-accepting chemotaxis protein [Leptospirales bacterium]|nr:methyl-accepting chemotaxis protein [Leptospirales bacterium]
MVSRFSISGRLYSIPAIVAFLLLAMIGFMLFQVRTIVEAGKVQGTYRNLAYKCGHAAGNLGNMRKLTTDLRLAVGTEKLAEQYDAWTKQYKEFETTLADMVALTTPEDRIALDRIKTAGLDYKDAIESNYARIKADRDFDQAKARDAFEAAREKVKVLYDQMDKKAEGYDHIATEQSKINDNQVDIMVKSVIAISLLTLLVGVGLTLLIARSILGPLHLIISRVEDVAEGNGDLTRRVALNSKDELGRLARALDKFLESTAEIVREVASSVTATRGVAEKLSEASHTLSSGTEEMSVQTQSIAAASTQLNQNIEVVSSSIEQMSISVREVARRSGDAAIVASEASSRTGAANSIVQELGQNAQQIGKVIDSIVDIADQTNLLSLNAAIEAADAGQAGMRFAVVAAQVKELAGQTGDSSEEIRSRIETIQRSTQETVSAIDSITQVIHKVNEVNSAVASFVEEQSIAAADVSRNATSAATVSTEVARNVAGVSQAIMEGAAEATRIADLAETLNGMARHLETSLSRFKT